MTFIHKDLECLQTNNTFPHFDFDRKLKFYICVSDIQIVYMQVVINLWKENAEK